MRNHQIEPGRPEDDRAAALLICSTDVGLYDLLSGGRRDLAAAFVAGQWRRDDCLFSHRLALVARDAAGLAGLVLSYTAEQHAALPQSREPGPEVPPDFQANRQHGLAEAAFLFPRLPAGALYVQNLAVSEVARGGGLGGSLLEAAIDAGRRNGCSSCHLDVAADNHVAVAFYRKHRFEVLVETRVPSLAERFGLSTHYRFVRPIEP